MTHTQNNGNGARFGRFMSVVVAGCLVAGVAGLWAMSAGLARLDERVANWTTIFEQRFETLDREIRDQDRRLDRLEQNP